ncbi:hypothetical protein RSA11_04485 [Exiguobacterium indicum]|uniref:Uncharacterized protein n=1 Tax=Exiguobacterium indicum TaxID=296995 RepID=A0AAW3MEJ9_9BACL|nr:hypothetical protein [Exiguobacterium indicum]KTR27922.1 hypothetical protein RSA11_04485 [Exiguobacterium indicum]
MTPELILKRYERGMTAEQIATLDNLSLAHVEEVISSSGVQPTGRNKAVKKIEPAVTRRRGRQPSVSDEDVVAWFRQGLTIGQIRLKAKTSYSGIKNRLIRMKLIDTDGNPVEPSEADLAAREVAATTEAEGFSERYTIAQLSKEELDMTDAIAEARNTAKDKWVHYVAHQIDKARIKTKFDVVEQDGKLIKQTEVRFVIEEEMR